MKNMEESKVSGWVSPDTVELKNKALDAIQIELQRERKKKTQENVSTTSVS